MFMETKGKTTSTIVNNGAISDRPNHKTERNAQQIAGKVSKTIIQLSMKDSKCFLIPIKIPMPVPINMLRTRPLKILTRVFHITEYDSGSLYTSIIKSRRYSGPGKNTGIKNREATCHNTKLTRIVATPGTKPGLNFNDFTAHYSSIKFQLKLTLKLSRVFLY